MYFLKFPGGSGDYSTPEARAFREHYVKLVDSVCEPDLPVFGSGSRFFSLEIISKETMEMVSNAHIHERAERVSKLFLVVMAALEVQPDMFESALEVFAEEHMYSQLAAMIRESCSMMKGERILIVQ